MTRVLSEKKESPVTGTKEEREFETSGWIVGRGVGRPVDRHRPVGHPGQASGSTADAVGHPSGRRLVADRPGRLVGFAGWTSITPCF
jgi:hypothetical protein